jgi:hypothetical protein
VISYEIYVDLIYVFLGEDGGSICKIDSGRLKKNSSSWVLSALGGIFRATEVKFNPFFGSTC